MPLSSLIMKRDTILLSRQNRLSSADRLKEKELRIVHTELRGNTSWFMLREAIMEIVYRIVLWSVVFCHYTWSQVGKNILFPSVLPESKLVNERAECYVPLFVDPLHISRVASETN